MCFLLGRILEPFSVNNMYERGLLLNPILFLPMIFHHVYKFEHQYVTQVNLHLQTSVNDLISYSLFDDDYLMMVKSIILVG